MRVGIAGTGFMGSTHARGWAETEAEISAFLAEEMALAEPLAERFEAKIYTDFEEMLDNVDLVDICTPTYLHHEMVMKSAAAGKHVMCEKPLARTLEQGREMVRTCRQKGVMLFPAHVVRFFPEYSGARDAVVRGDIGQPAVIRLARETFCPKKASDNWFLDFEKSGGIILDLMIHDLDYAQWLCGEVESVYAKSIGIENAGLPFDHALVILEHRSGALSHVEGSWAFPPPEFHTRFEIAGRDGLITFDSDESTPIGLHLHSGGSEDTPDIPLPASPLHKSPYHMEIERFYNAVKEGTPPPVSAEEGLAALQIALAAIESAGSGVPVTLKHLPEVEA